MRGSVPLSNEGYSLVLDIYLGGVSGAIVKNGVLEHVAHNKTSIPEENTILNLLQKTKTLLQKTTEDLLLKKEVVKSYIFIDAPLSYTESAEVLFQDDDKTFFDRNPKEIETGALTLPQTYANLLGEHVADGVVIEHPPKNHTINGYATSNLSLKGQKSAQISQQWIQREVYAAIQQIKRVFALGEVVFLPFPTIEKNKVVLLLGDVISTIRFKDTTILIGAGTSISIVHSAQIYNQSSSFIESILKGVARHHGIKDHLYKNIVHTFEQAFTKALKQTPLLLEKRISSVYIGDSYMFPVIEDSLSSFKNIEFTEKNTVPNARLLYINENKVQ